MEFRSLSCQHVVKWMNLLHVHLQRFRPRAAVCELFTLAWLISISLRCSTERTLSVRLLFYCCMALSSQITLSRTRPAMQEKKIFPNNIVIRLIRCSCFKNVHPCLVKSYSWAIWAKICLLHLIVFSLIAFAVLLYQTTDVFVTVRVLKRARHQLQKKVRIRRVKSWLLNVHPLNVVSYGRFKVSPFWPKKHMFGFFHFYDFIFLYFYIFIFFIFSSV